MRWQLKETDERIIEELVKELKIPYMTAKLLVLRGIDSPDSAKKFLNPTREMLRSPFLMKDMEKAVEILIRARENREKVIVHGDYDVDGTTGTAVFYTFLKDNGWIVNYYIPKRVDNGYGIQPQFVEEIAQQGYKILLTVDCGITAYDAIGKAKELGLTVIVTDHHQPKETLPNADAVINPKRADDEYPFKEFAGVGVAYKVISAIAEKLGLHYSVVDEFLDIVALGTVADMVELVDENRYIVKEGLKRLNLSSKIGIRRLTQKLGISYISSRDIGYRIAPKLNAAGRLDSPDDAFKLLITEDEADANELVELLVGYNTERQNIESRIFADATRKIESEGLDKNPIIVVHGEKWHLGVIGIVATRLVHIYNKPVLVISVENGTGRGSARSVEGVNIIEILERFRDLFEDFGGHTMALGFTMRSENIPIFISQISEKISEEDLKKERIIWIDDRVSVDSINEEFIKSLELLEPYGHGNPEPVFLIENCSIEKYKYFGDSGNNLRITLKGKEKTLEGIGFGVSRSLADVFGVHLNVLKLDVVGNIRLSDYKPQINVLDYRIYQNIDEEAVDKNFLVTFINNWRNQREEDYVYTKVDDHFSTRLSKTEQLVNLERPIALLFNIERRNSFLHNLLRKGRTLIICPTSIEAHHIYESLVRNYNGSISLGTSLNLIKDSHSHVVTNAVYGDKFLNLNDFDYVVLNEIQFLRDFDVSLYERIIEKFGKKAFYTTVFKFEINGRVYESDYNHEFSLEDKRNQPKTVTGDLENIVYLFSSQNYVEPFYNAFIKKNVSKDAVFYSSQLAPFQRAIISSLLRRKKIKRLVSSTNNDGLPGLLGVCEVKLFDFPYTISELLDAVSGEGKVQLKLNYSSQDVNKKYSGIKKLFPSLEEAKLAVQTLNDYLPLSLEEFETLVETLPGVEIPKGVIKSIYRDLNGIIDGIVKPVEFDKDMVLRLKERDIELGFFEKYTLKLESLSVKEIYRLLEERYLYDASLEIYS